MRAHSGTGAEASCLTLIGPSALVPPPSPQAAAPDRGHPLFAGPHRLHAAGVPAVLPLQHPQEEGEEQEADSAGPAGGQRGRRGLPTGTAGSGGGGEGGNVSKQGGCILAQQVQMVRWLTRLSAPGRQNVPFWIFYKSLAGFVSWTPTKTITGADADRCS